MRYLVSFSFILMLLSGGCNQSEKPPPNIVFIMLDDLGWTDLGYTGSEYYETPVIDKLAGEGMIFTNAYSNAANCAPTRASFLSGLYMPRHGVYTVARPDRGELMYRRLIPNENRRTIKSEKITIAEALKEGGYLSAAIGKMHVLADPVEQGFDFAIDRPDLNVRGHFNGEGEYLADLLTEETIKFIRNNNPDNTGSPFFVYLSHHAVHTPIQAKTDYIDEFSKKETSGCHNNPTYAAMIKSVDEGIDRIIQTLEELELDNTIVFFFSDNGGHGTYTCQDPLRGGKGMFYEGGIRVPMFVYWPGSVKAGAVCDEPVIGTDFYTTFLELAGLEKSDNYKLDGESILPLLKGKNSRGRESLFWHFPAYLQSYAGLKEDSRDTIFRSRPVSVVRKGDWKLLMFHEEWSLDGGRENIRINNSLELYNLREDIGESNNLALKNIEKRDELLDELLMWIKETDAPVPSLPNPEYRFP